MKRGSATAGMVLGLIAIIYKFGFWILIAMIPTDNDTNEAETVDVEPAEEESEEYELISEDPLEIAEEIIGDDYIEGLEDEENVSVDIYYGDPIFSGQRGFERDIENILEQYHHLEETPDSEFYLLDDEEEISYSYEFSSESIEDINADEGIEDIKSFAATYYEREDEDEEENGDEESEDEDEDLDTETAIKEVVNDQISSDDKLDEVNFNEDEEFVLITINETEGLTTNLTRDGMHMNSLQMLEGLEGIDGVNNVDFQYTLPLFNEYGEESITQVMRLSFNEETIERIEFDNIAFDNAPNIADDYSIHPALE